MAISNSYELALHAFTVIDIAVSLEIHASPSSSMISVWEELMERGGDEICLVKDQHRFCGFLEPTDFGVGNMERSAGEIAKQISPAQIVAASMPIFDLLPLFEKHYFFFVLTRNEITHVVSFNHIDELPMKLCLFSLFMELESEMLQHLTSRSADSGKYLSYLSAGRLCKARKLCALKFKDETNDRLLLCTTFIDKMTIFQRDQRLSKLLPFTSKLSAKDFFLTVERLRNSIAHSDTILNDIRDPKSMNYFIGNVKKSIRALADSVSI